MFSCDLLENLYLCGSNNNFSSSILILLLVVICLKICTFAVATTTLSSSNRSTSRCDLLENLYLCGSNNNINCCIENSIHVVICLKICTFAVATTTSFQSLTTINCCDLLENLYLCGSNNNLVTSTSTHIFVVICLKICTFAVATTTYNFS